MGTNTFKSQGKSSYDGRTHNPLVLGSNPSGPTNRLLSLDFTIDWFFRCSRHRPSGENLRTRLPRPAPQRDVASSLSRVNSRCAAASATRLHPSPVNDVALVRYRSTIICRKKKDETRKLFRSQTPLESLAC